MRPLLVHVIYVPGTVNTLLPFAETLINCTNARFVLVGNGCDADETAVLRRRAEIDPDRIDFVDLESDVMLGHGTVLDQLLTRLPNDEPVFAFADTDIFASGPVDLEQLRPTAGEFGRCSGLPIWQTIEDRVAPSGFDVLSGRHLVTESGTTVACTYAAAYDAHRLRAVLAEWHLSLLKYSWHEIPRSAQQELQRQSAVFNRYDTSKVVSIIGQHDGLTVPYVDIEHFVHIGALSGQRPEPPIRFRRLRRLPALLRSPRLLVEKIRERLPNQERANEQRSIEHLIERRLAACALVDGLAAGDPNPPVPAWCSDNVLKHLRDLVPASQN
ncbi:MAG: hypothetical protein ACI83Y_002400 [Candidatus Azotimanducaceae bacterium]